jgi:pyruvate/2-oxoglutarate dehydrogenase complex dihydrolipoamide acyltransferase (E2) component
VDKKINPYKVVDLPPARREVPNLLDLYWWKHSVYGLLEVDVTMARKFIAEYKAQTGEALSFTGYMAFCLARAVDADKSVQAYLKSRRQLVLFDDVDVGLTVERQIGGTRAPIGYVIRRANHKTYLEIHQEIRSVQARPAPPDKGMAPWLRFAMLLPWPLPRLFGALIRTALRRNPTISVATMGTVGMTAIGMFGRGSFWGLTPPMHSLFLIIGSIARKPAVVNERIEPRDILNLTVAFDHDVVDGAPAARFGRRLVELIESGYGLAEVEAVPAPEAESVAQPTPVMT